MQILFVDDFKCDGCIPEDIMANISMYCHSIDEEIKIYSRNITFRTVGQDLTFPNVVYIDKFIYNHSKSLNKIFPDLTMIGEAFVLNNIYNFGKLKEIEYYKGFRGIFNTYKINCKPLGNKMFRFTTDEGSWVIKVNGHD